MTAQDQIAAWLKANPATLERVLPKDIKHICQWQKYVLEEEPLKEYRFIVKDIFVLIG